MPEIYRKNIRRAVKNVVSYGDTDILPYSFENVLIRKNEENFISLVENMSSDFKNQIEQLSPQFESTLIPTGYNGYRWVTQIDPFWNAYLLSAIIRHGEDIELARLPIENNQIHSYRYDSDEEKDSLFLDNYNWRSFMMKSYTEAQTSQYVIITDISEFYRRIYHHRLENALNRSISGNIPKNIISLLTKFSNGTSYGLPVGGPAARIMAELVLNQIDRLLLARGISFCRFVDDIHLFAQTEQDSYRAIQILSELLITNQGLSLQKSKTRIIKSSEFINTFPEHLKAEIAPSTDRERLLSLSLNFDPYSSTGEEDYETLKESLGKIDFLALLNEELSKSQVHAPTISKLIQSLKICTGKVQSDAIKTLMSNLDILYPVFSKLLIVLSSISDQLDESIRKIVAEKIIQLINDGSYLIELDAHKCYAVRLLKKYNDYRVDAIFTKWLNNGSPMLKRDVIIGFMARNGWDHLSDFKNRVSGETPWVRRAMISASYGLGDEGRHWRQAQNFNAFEKFTQQSMSNISANTFGDLL